MPFRKTNATLIFCLIALGALPGAAREAIYFHNGFSLEAEAHQESNGVVTLTLGGGTLEFPIASVSRIEALPERPSAKPARVNAGANDFATAATTDDLLVRAAFAQGLEADLIRSVAQVESGLRPGAISPKGAIGLMQLMPATAAVLAVDPMETAENALGGAKYLRELLVRYKGNSALALAAYNAGPGAVARYGGVPPFEETQRYVRRVLREYQRLLKTSAAAPALGRTIANSASHTFRREILTTQAGSIE